MTPSGVDTPATFDDPLQFPVGIDYVAVNGALVIDNGQHTGVPPRPRAAQPLAQLSLDQVGMDTMVTTPSGTTSMVSRLFQRSAIPTSGSLSTL